MSATPALDIIHRSRDLVSGFLLWTAARGLGPSDEAAAGDYLIWRALFAAPLGYSRALDRATLDLITRPRPPYLSAIEEFLARQAGKTQPLAEIHRWYYAEAAPQHGLGPLLSVREMRALAEAPSLAAPEELRLLDDILVETNAEIRRTCNLATPAGRERYRAWKRATPFAQRAPWFPFEHIDAEPPEGAGLNLIGYADAILGLGEDLQALRAAARRAGRRAQIVNVPIPAAIGSPKGEAAGSGEPLFEVNLFCMPFSETERYRLRHPQHLSRAACNIGHWPWELSDVPAYWRHAFDEMDEIWTVSPFTRDVLRRATDKPVHYLPPLVQLGEVAPFDLAGLELEPGAFTFLVVCDLNSFVARKNPVGAVEAFRRAFPSPDSRERLVVKTLNGHANAPALQSVVDAAGPDKRVIVVDGAFARPDLLGLIQAADCLVSLHRAEGFGRVLAEALLLETPVIATGYSGSATFLDETTGFPVAYALVPVAPQDYCYAEGSVWAEPSLDHAAELMRRVAAQPAEAKARARAGRDRIAANHGLDAAARALAERMAQVDARLYTESQ